jgi:hypothetical protein
MTPDIVGYIAWGVVGLVFLLFAAWVVGYIEGMRCPCDVCAEMARHQVEAQARVVREGGGPILPHVELRESEVSWQKSASRSAWRRRTMTR